MLKRGKKFNVVISIFQILLLISISFSFSFIFSNLVSAQDLRTTDFAKSKGLSYKITEAESTGQPPSVTLNPVQTAGGTSIATTSKVYTLSNPSNIEIGSQTFSNVDRLVINPDGTGVLYQRGAAEGTKIAQSQARSVLSQQTALNNILQPPTAVDANLGITKLPIDFTGSVAGNFFVAHLVEGVVWGGVLALGIKFLGPTLGLSEEQSNAAAIAAFAGIVGAKGLYGLFGSQGYAANTPFLSSVFGTVPGAFLTGGLIAFAIFAALYKTQKKKLVSFQCLPFEPPLGGAHCEDCNKDPFRPCSEYRCKSLGQACQLLNPGTGEERCAWVNPKDVNSPTIQSWTDALKPSELAYVPDNTIRPPNRGVKIVRGKNECIQPFTALEFGITTNEPSQCKIDYILKNKLDDMQFFFGGSNYYRYNHTQKMKLPGPDNASGDLAPELENDGTFSLFTRCRDANGNENVDAFVFNFCVDPSPDTTPPIIEGTSINSGSPVRFNSEQVPIELYTNEPAECKWSRISKSYEDMENAMKCDTQTFQINADLNYVCRGNLTGIKNNEENKFYFRCKDQPGKPESDRNVNVQSYELVLKGSQPLNILNVGPNGTISSSTATVPVDLKVRTDDGAEEGKSICYFSNTGQPDSFIAMFETNSFEHRQSLDFVSGKYKYFFRCVDLGGNSAETSTEFNVLVDKEAPKVTRAYRDEGLKIVTNEDAECAYSLKNCNYNFEEGLPMIYSNPSNKRNHFAEWKANSVYYIKCQDLYENRPSPNECSIVVNAIELASGAKV